MSSTQKNTSPHAQPAHAPLLLGALGVVYGDIGTSPLYALKESFKGLEPTFDHVLGVLSLVFWSITFVVSLKYVAFILKADNRGEGGGLALLALVTEHFKGRVAAVAAVIGIFAAALFFGDVMLTPAISVLSAVEGLQIAAPQLAEYVIPLTVFILVALFAIQKFGTNLVGAAFGPVMLLWFATLAVTGVLQILEHPEVLRAVNPGHAVNFIAADPVRGFLILASVFLAVTGAEALYADLGHFGRSPIRRAWLFAVMPALLANYFGQGALVFGNPEALDNPFYRMVPGWATIPMVVLATAATIIASQAVISAAYSLACQAMQLGYLPRMTIVHTSGEQRGQVYVPVVNWALLASVVYLVIAFGSSSNLAAAYGLAVSGTMLTTTVLFALVMFSIWRVNRAITFAVIGSFLLVDLAFLAANATKILHGGWFPLVIAMAAFTLFTTWKRGRELLLARVGEDAMPEDLFLNSLSERVKRVPGTAVYLTLSDQGVPRALLHNLKHNGVLHERVIFLTVITEDRPYVPEVERVQIRSIGGRLYRLSVRYGFIEKPDIPAALAASHPVTFDLMETSFFLNRETILPSARPGMARWRESIFSWMSRNAATPMEFFRLPPNRVVELGSQVEI